MPKVVHILQREDGSQVRITGQPCYDLGLKLNVGVYVHYRNSPEGEWLLASDEKHPDWRTMSVAEYIERGRSQVDQLTSHGEIFRVCNEVRAGERDRMTLITDPPEPAVVTHFPARSRKSRPR